MVEGRELTRAGKFEGNEFEGHEFDGNEEGSSELLSDKFPPREVPGGASLNMGVNIGPDMLTSSWCVRE